MTSNLFLANINTPPLPPNNYRYIMLLNNHITCME
jgi:hypothetical protein